MISNGTAVLGLGDIGALASKPVMEGKAVLFKKFAGIDAVDLEIDEKDPEKFAAIVCALEPSFGAVNLEDIRAPECFEVERLCHEKMGIPVFHDDQHGTAVVVAAAITNALMLRGAENGQKSSSGGSSRRDLLSDVRLVCTGAGAAAIACMDLLCDLGMKRVNIRVADRAGILHAGRAGLPAHKRRYADANEDRDATLASVLVGADIFLGLSGPDSVTVEEISEMARDPIILALANPTPEVSPEEVRKARPDSIIATGRSDYPNQGKVVFVCFGGRLDLFISSHDTRSNHTPCHS